MYHQAQVSTVCDQLELSFKDSNSKYEVAQILNEKEAFLEEVSNMPDAIILFRPKPEYITNNREMYIVVFVELERSYASFKRVKSKMLGYEMQLKIKYILKNLVYLSLIKEFCLCHRRMDNFKLLKIRL